MSLPELVRKSAEKLFQTYCRERAPSHADEGARLGFRIRGDGITLFEELIDQNSAAGMLATPIARFRFCRELNQWTLHYPDQERRWRFYLNIGPSLDLGKLLRHLDEDPTRTFWG